MPCVIVFNFSDLFLLDVQVVFLFFKSGCFWLYLILPYAFEIFMFLSVLNTLFLFYNSSILLMSTALRYPLIAPMLNYFSVCFII